jgi:hypothetical protein
MNEYGQFSLFVRGVLSIFFLDVTLAFVWMATALKAQAAALLAAALKLAIAGEHRCCYLLPARRGTTYTNGGQQLLQVRCSIAAACVELVLELDLKLKACSRTPCKIFNLCSVQTPRINLSWLPATKPATLILLPYF